MSLLGKVILVLILIVLIIMGVYSMVLFFKLFKNQLTEKDVKNAWCIYVVFFILCFKVIDGTIYAWLLKL